MRGEEKGKGVKARMVGRQVQKARGAVKDEIWGVELGNKQLPGGWSERATRAT